MAPGLPVPRFTPGTRLGPYEVAGLVGAGGMGEVYRARDPRLGRTVAIKVLREVASDPVAVERFEREARAISALQHPHICAVHDVGEQHGLRYLVMEYLEGESLASRLQKGPLPVEQVLELGVQLADALSRAHREGIVHRDLKPANIMLTRGGVKLLDFGLARGASATAGPAPGTVDPAVTSEGSRPGTYPYMAPEQLHGSSFDHRADLWALGCVLFEMASGRRAFTGATPHELMRAILSDDVPRLADAVPDIPAPLDHVVRVCLDRSPEGRWQSATDVARELTWLQSSSSSSRGAVPPARRRLHAARVLGALTVLLLLVTTAGWWRATRPRPPSSIQAALLPPAGLALPALVGSVAVSPDGRGVVFAARDASGRTLLRHRALGGAEATPIAGTEGAMQPFWSPDGQAIGFHAFGALQRVPLAGGSPETVTTSPFLFGAAWGADDVVVAAPQFQGPLMMWRRGSPAAEPATTLDATRGERLHRWPSFLPGGRVFLFTSTRLDAATGLLESEIWTQEVAGERRTRVARAASNAVFTAGHLLYAVDGNVVAQRFDPGRLEASGEPRVVARGVLFDANVNAAVFSAGGGLLAWAPGGLVGLSRLLLLDRSGREIGMAAENEDFWTPRVSPDGMRVAVERIDRRSGNRDVYVYATAPGVAPVRLTFDVADEFTPVWSPDGRRVAYASRRGDTSSMNVREVTGALTETRWPSWTAWGFPTDWTPDGLLVNRMAGTATADVVLLAEDGTVRELAATSAIERDAVLSPDGRRLALVVWAAGRPDVLVQDLASGARRQVSTEGGRQPRWSRDGRELFHVTPAGRLVSVRLDPGGELRAEPAQELFPLRLRRTDIAQYDVRPDGTFLVNVEAGPDSYAAINVTLGWSGEPDDPVHP